MTETMQGKKQDASEFIMEILQNMPEEKKKIALGVLIGFSLGKEERAENAQPA